MKSSYLKILFMELISISILFFLYFFSVSIIVIAKRRKGQSGRKIAKLTWTKYAHKSY